MLDELCCPLPASLSEDSEPTVGTQSSRKISRTGPAFRNIRSTRPRRVIAVGGSSQVEVEVTCLLLDLLSTLLVVGSSRPRVSKKYIYRSIGGTRHFPERWIGTRMGDAIIILVLRINTATGLAFCCDIDIAVLHVAAGLWSYALNGGHGPRVSLGSSQGLPAVAVSLHGSAARHPSTWGGPQKCQGVRRGRGRKIVRSASHNRL